MSLLLMLKWDDEDVKAQCRVMSCLHLVRGYGLTDMMILHALSFCFLQGACVLVQLIRHYKRIGIEKSNAGQLDRVKYCFLCVSHWTSFPLPPAAMEDATDVCFYFHRSSGQELPAELQPLLQSGVSGEAGAGASAAAAAAAAGPAE